MKLLVVHAENEDMDKLMSPFGVEHDVEPYEVIIARSHGEVIEKFGYVFKAMRMFPNLPVPDLAEILNDWFEGGDNELFFGEGEILKQISTKNPYAKHYRYHKDYEAIKGRSGEYVETLKLSDWNIMEQFREEYQQSLFYWKNHNTGNLPASLIASHDALGAMVPRAILIDGQWIQAPQEDMFDMDLFGFKTTKMRQEMHIWIRQIGFILRPYRDSAWITSMHYK